MADNDLSRSTKTKIKSRTKHKKKKKSSSQDRDNRVENFRKNRSRSKEELPNYEPIREHNRSFVWNRNNNVYKREFQLQSNTETQHLYGFSSPMTSDLSEKLNNLEQQCNFLRTENENLKNALFNVQMCNTNNDGPEVDIIFANDDLAQRYKAEIESFLIKLLSQDSNENVHKNIENLEELFVVNYDKGSSFLNYEHLPMYETNTGGILGEEKVGQQRFLRTSCFNCLGNHPVSQCREEMNYHIIAQRKYERLSTTYMSPRYHMQTPSFDAFKPGAISKELRDALQLESNQVPLYIYRMRLIGYPPGWLEEATVQNSGLTLYGKDESTPTRDESSKVQYDPTKLIDFPGFNVPLCPDFTDESEQLGYPAFQHCQLRSFMEKYLPKQDQTKKRKLKEPDLFEGAKVPRLEEDTMDIERDSDDEVLTLVDECSASPPDNFVPPLPPTPPPLPPPPQMDPDDSLSLTDLEEQKKLLMQALSADASDSNECTEIENDSPSALEDSQMSDSSLNSSQISITLGSPSFPSFSSCLKVPDSFKFKEGIQGCLFEETPQTTGGFKRVKDAIKKIKERLKI